MKRGKEPEQTKTLLDDAGKEALDSLKIRLQQVLGP